MPRLFLAAVALSLAARAGAQSIVPAVPAPADSTLVHGAPTAGPSRLADSRAARVAAWPVGVARHTDAPPARAAAELSAGTRRAWAATWMGRGALVGAGLGVVSGLLVRDACGDYCEDNAAQGIALHVAAGALAGAAVGGIAYRLRRPRP